MNIQATLKLNTGKYVMQSVQIKSLVFFVLVLTLSLLEFSLLTAEAKPKKFVIAQKGASAYAPENTIAAYRLAIEQGAEFVEQDLQITKDGILICLQDLTLERTTNIEEVFPERFRQEEENGQMVKRWYAVDFMLTEIKKLDAGSWFNEKFKDERVPTFIEAISAIKDKAGLCPELNNSEFYRQSGLDMETLVLTDLKRFELDRVKINTKTAIIIHSFSEESLRRLAVDLKSNLSLLLLVDVGNDRRLSAVGLLEASKFVRGIGLAKEALTKEVAERIHRYNLTVAVYSFSANKKSKFQTLNEEMDHYLNKFNADAVFTENPDQFPRKK